MKESQCQAILTMKCVEQLADIGCRYYQESRRTPLKCAHRDGRECMNWEACREAVEALIANVRLPKS